MSVNFGTLRARARQVHEATLLKIQAPVIQSAAHLALAIIANKLETFAKSDGLLALVLEFDPVTKGWWDPLVAAAVAHKINNADNPDEKGVAVILTQKEYYGMVPVLIVGDSKEAVDEVRNREHRGEHSLDLLPQLSQERGFC